MSHAWVPSSPDWFAELGALDALEPWRVWWLTQSAENPYNTCFRSPHPELPVFVPAGVAETDVVSLIVEDVDPNEHAPPTVSSVAPVPENRRDTRIFASPVAQRSTLRLHESVDNVADICL